MSALEVEEVAERREHPSLASVEGEGVLNQASEVAVEEALAAVHPSTQQQSWLQGLLEWNRLYYLRLIEAEVVP